jgi:sodium/bile acid cotransporter 7
MLRFIRGQWFLLALAAMLVASVAAPGIGKSGGPLAPERWRGILVAAIFLISGLELRTRELGDAVRDVRLHVFVQGVSLGVAPVLFYGAARALALTSLPPALLQGVIVLGCLPTTVTSGVVFTRASRGDEAGALFNASLGNLLGVIVTPWLILGTTGREGSVVLSAIALELAAKVAAPFVLGQLTQQAFRESIARVRPWFGRVSMGLLLALVYFVFCDSLSHGLEVSGAQIGAALIVLLAIHGALIATALRLSLLDVWRFSRAKRTAAVICSTQKTAALGLPLLEILYRENPNLGLIALPLLIYHPLQLLVASAASSAWRRYNARENPPHPTPP